MTVQRVTIELPGPIFRQLARIAEATQQPLEALVAQSVVSNLSPSVDNFESELQPELLRMQTLSIEDLLAIAQAQVETSQHERHVDLLGQNQQHVLSPSEGEELNNLRLAADRLMLCKAYAWSLLRWRGHRIPPLQELPIHINRASYSHCTTTQ